MRIVFLLLSLLCVSWVSTAYAGFDLGISVGDEGIRGFHLAIGDYYRVPEREVLVVRERRIPDEEIPVVFFLASRARVAPSTIIDLRLSGRSWLDITLHYGLSPEIFYIPVDIKKMGPPYGKAYGYYKNKPKKEWKKMKFSDGDVVDLVNLKFISEHYKYSPEKVIQMRGEGKKFVSINDTAYKEKHGSKEKSKEKFDADKEKHGKGRGKKNH
ncbi:MAG: hypothetical protein HY755_10495 [Nitrospirae bacterium]|nr:hypothetical protein [Nitrospirota bacterium]